MNIELTTLQAGKILKLVSDKYETDKNNLAFYLGLKHNLLSQIKKEQTEIETKIHATETGKERNKLCDENMRVLELIKTFS